MLGFASPIVYYELTSHSIDTILLHQKPVVILNGDVKIIIIIVHIPIKVESKIILSFDQQIGERRAFTWLVGFCDISVQRDDDLHLFNFMKIHHLEV